MALFAMTILTFIAVQVSYDTSVDYVVAAQQVNRIKAFYAAKAGIEISLLRIMLYKQAVASLGDTLGQNKTMLDPIWNFPFMWPPTAALALGKASEVDKDMMKEAVAESLMKGESYTTTVVPEGNRLDINDLGSDIKALRKSAMTQVLRIFQSELQHNETFQRKYGGYRFEELVNNIADYIDEDSESLNGGDESSAYQKIDEKDIKMPPNRPFRTLDELHQVAGMKDDFYNVLAPRVTVYGTKGINVNYAEHDVLMAIDPSMTEDAVSHVISRRNDLKSGGPFKDDKDFLGFIQSYGANVKAITDAQIPFVYDVELNFRIVSTGLAGNVKREITAVTYDFANLSTRLAQKLDQQDQGQNPQTTNPNNPNALTNNNLPANQQGQQQNGANANAGPKLQAPKGRPSVVYWEEN